MLVLITTIIAIYTIDDCLLVGPPDERSALLQRARVWGTPAARLGPARADHAA